MKEELENIKNDIGNLNSSSIIDYALEVIRTNEIRNKIAPYWSFLILMQFAINYSSDSKFLPQAKKVDCRRILDKISKVQDKYLLGNFGFTDETITRKTMSILSNQQFWLYNKFPEYDIVRQLFLFVDLDTEKKSFQKIFKDKFNVGLYSFLQYSFYSYLAFEQIDKTNFNGRVNKDLIELFSATGGELQKDNYLDLLTLGRKESKKDELSKITKLKSPILQPFDISHWIKKPFIQHKNEIRVLSTSLFSETIKYYIFDGLKQEQIFQNTFSTSRFERYVEKGLKETKLQFKNEKELEKQKSKKTKIVDFLIEDNILVECKATELVPLPSVSPEDEITFKAIKTTIAKGYEQLYTFAKDLESQNLFGVIITYKPMYLGDGIDIASESMREFTGKLTTKDLIKIPRENIFVLSIDEWDNMIQLTKHKKCSLYNLLLEIKEKHKVKRSYFQGHIEEIANNEEIPPFDFLQKRYKEFRESVFSEGVRNQIKKYDAQQSAKRQ